MERYQSQSGRPSGVVAYELGEGEIKVQFQGGSVYLYNEAKPGAEHVAKMKELALAGQGLATYISQKVRQNYAKKVK
jgi:hypothetical protein